MMQLAVEAVKEKTLTIWKAAKHYEVPRSTLEDYVKGKYIQGSPQGHPPFLTARAEENLARYINWMAEHGWGLTCKLVNHI